MKSLEEVMAKLSEPADFARPSDRRQGQSYLKAEDVVKDLHEITDGCYSTSMTYTPSIAALPEGDINTMFSSLMDITIHCTDGEINRVGVGATPYRYQGQGYKDNPTGIIKRCAANAFMNACKTFPRYKDAEVGEGEGGNEQPIGDVDIPVCAQCGTKIKDAPSIGQTAAQIAASRKRNYGEVLCTDCMKKHPNYKPYDPNKKRSSNKDTFSDITGE